MTTSTEPAASGVSCTVDRTCPPEAACGCGGPDPVSSGSTRRGGATATVAAAVCAAACLAVPLVAGGLAAVGASATGEWLIVAGAVLGTAVVGVLVLRRGDGSPC